MSRSGYSYDIDQWDLIRWRGAVKAAIRGKRGQRFLRELAAALDAMPVKELVAEELVTLDGEVCAMGCVAVARGIPAEKIQEVDPEEKDDVASLLGIAPALAAEIAEENDECPTWRHTNAARARWVHMRRWVNRKMITGGC